MCCSYELAEGERVRWPAPRGSAGRGCVVGGGAFFARGQGLYFDASAMTFA